MLTGNHLLFIYLNINEYFKFFIVLIFNVLVVVKLLSRIQLFCDPTDHSPPGSSLHGISQARILE